MSTVAFIGLGNMGLPMARNLLKAGHRVIGYDILADNRTAAVQAGAETAESIPAAVAHADVVITMLPAGQQVRATYLGPDGIIARSKSDAILVDSSTIDVETARAVAAEAGHHGKEMVDAPVSGGTGGAAAGTLTFMVGGSDRAFARVHPLLEAMGKTIVHAGPAGAGQAAKICNNMILGISMVAVSEAFNLADRLGLDRQKLFDISSKSSGQCWSLTTYCPVPGPVPTSPANRGYQPGFTADMMLKDLKLAQQAAHAVGASTPLGAQATALYQLMVAGGSGSLDFSGIIRLLDGE